MTDASVRPGRPALAIVGGVLAAASVVAELIYPVQSGDGTSLIPILHAAYLVAWVIGWALIAMAAWDLRKALPGSRAATIGSWAAVVGAVALAVSGVVQLIGVLAAGEAIVAAFVLFLLAFPVLVMAGVALGVAARSRSSLAFGLLLLAAAGFLMAFLATADPYHDIGLIGGILAFSAGMWVLAGPAGHLGS